MGYFRPSTSSGSARLFGRSFSQRIARAATVALHVLEEVRARRQRQQHSSCVASDRARGTSAVAREISVVAIKRIDRQKSRLNRRGFQTGAASQSTSYFNVDPGGATLASDHGLRQG
jgi:hypothetical protein